LKGMAQPLSLYRLLAAREGVSTASAGVQQLVGRDSELAWIVQCAAQVERGDVRLVQLMGEAGIGKSALLRSAEAMLRGRGWLVALSEAHSAQRHSPYGSLGRLLAALLGLSLPAPGQEPEAVDALRARLAALDDALLLRMPLLRE